MIESKSFVKKINERYPAPEIPNADFTNEDISAFEKALSTELPSDYYEFLKLYGFGSFSDYFYVCYPFTENGTNNFISDLRQKKELYENLEADTCAFSSDRDTRIDCKFVDGKLVIINGEQEIVETMRTEKIDLYTRSKIIAFGNHFPYKLYPDEGGLIFWGYTDDADFFLRYNDGKISVVILDLDYYEFDMSITEFIYEYLTRKIKIPMIGDDDNWEYTVYMEDWRN